MTENQFLLLQEAQALVTGLLTNKLNKSIRFHTLQHTQEVVGACDQMVQAMQISEDDRFALAIAAWFHDTGYVSGNSNNHESLSIEQANEFLSAHDASEELKNKVAGCIHATRLPQNPKTTIEQIICDADLFHLGTDDFKTKSRLLREELIEFEGKELSKKEWRKINIRFLEGHRYFTVYGKEKLQPVKETHLSALNHKEKNNDEMKPDKKPARPGHSGGEKDKKKDKDKSEAAAAAAAETKRKKEKESQSERGMATVFRIMAQTQNNLSQMADSKANILISVNAIILSIVVTGLIEKLQTDTYLQLPVAVIVLVCVTTIVFSILATRPNVSSGRFTRDDISAKRTNLLFFGNFHNVSLEDYNWGMTEMLNDKYYMNNSMIKDAYFLGVVLAKKYKYLRIAYNIFMFGLIAAVLAFVIAAVLPQATEVYR